MTQQAPFPEAARPAHPNPLADTPIRDWIRDGSAVVLLLVSLALPWSFVVDGSAVTGGGFSVVGAGRIEVVLLTILSVLSIAVTYLACFGVLGHGLTLGRVVALRAALNIPYVVLVLVYVVLDGIDGRGLGAAAVLGLAGALLAAGTREFETRSLDAGSVVVRGSFAVLAVAFVVILITSLVGLLLPLVSSSHGSPVQLVGLVLPLLAAVGVLALAGSVFRRSETARMLAVGLGAVVLGAVLIDAMTGFVLGTERGALGIDSLRAGGYPAMWLAALGAVCATSSLRAAMRPTADLTAWFVVARQTLLLIGGAGVVLAVLDIGTLISSAGVSVGLLIGQLLCHVVIAVGALIARVQLVSNPARSRVTVLGMAAAIGVVGIVALVLGTAVEHELPGIVAVSRSAVGALLWAPPAWALVGEVGLAGLVGFALLVPASVREYYAQFAPAVSASTANAYPGVGTAAAAASAPSVSHAEGARRAADPSTPPAELHAMASDPALWSSLAANPALYPDLRAWLENTGDPDVLAVLQSRSR